MGEGLSTRVDARGRRSRRRRVEACWSALLAGALGAALPALAALQAVPAKNTDTMAVKSQGRVLEITSPSGVGSGQLVRNGAAWPTTLKVRLKLKELEHFRVTAGDVSLVCALERPGGVTSERVCRLGEQRMDPPVRVKSAFEVQVPAELLATQADSMVVEWVDRW